MGAVDKPLCSLLARLMLLTIRMRSKHTTLKHRLHKGQCGNQSNLMQVKRAASGRPRQFLIRNQLRLVAKVEKLYYLFYLCRILLRIYIRPNSLLKRNHALKFRQLVAKMSVNWKILHTIMLSFKVLMWSNSWKNSRARLRRTQQIIKRNKTQPLGHLNSNFLSFARHRWKLK